MSVEITLPPHLIPPDEPKKRITVSGKTAGECLKELVRIYPALEEKLYEKDGSLGTYISIYVNNKNAYPEDLETQVKAGDEIAIVLVFSGG